MGKKRLFLQSMKILKDLRDLIEESKRIPLTFNVIIEKREAMLLLDSLEETLLRANKAENDEKRRMMKHEKHRVSI